MLLLVFVVLLGTVVTVNSDQPEVEMHSDIVHVDDVGAETGHHMLLVCRATGFITSDIILNIKKNRCVQTKEDGVETSGVKPYGDIYWRRDYVIILKFEVSHYSCEVVHASSRFRVEKGWDPESDGEGRIISSEFIETTPPEVKMFAENSKVQTNIMLTCLASGFYPNIIIMNMKRNGRILTREDGVKSSRVCSYEDDAFQRIDSVEIKKSDKSDYTCEVIHDASDTHVEKFWDHHPPLSDTDGAAVIIGPVVGVLVLVLVVVLLYRRRRRIRGTLFRYFFSRSRKGYSSAPPDVEMEIKNRTDKTKNVLMCLVKGFSPKDIILKMKKNGCILTEENGVRSSGVHLNRYGVFQRRDCVEVLKSEVSHYSCEIIHAASGYHVEHFWDSGNTIINDEDEILLEESENVLVEI